MTRPFAPGVPVELWDEIFDHIPFTHITRQSTSPPFTSFSTFEESLWITGDTSVAARKLETLVHLDNTYPGFLTHPPIICEF